MPFPSVFEKSTADECIARLEKLNHESKPLWGKMNVAQMLAHVNVAYDLSNGKIEANNSAAAKFLLKLFVKKTVVGDKIYKKNSRTAPIFTIADERDFEEEKAQLIANIRETQELGIEHFEGKESPSFGALTAEEWSNQFYKHMDHHFQQFGI